MPSRFIVSCAARAVGTTRASPSRSISDQGLGRDGFDLRHNDVRALGFDQRAQGDGIGHVDDMRTVRDLVTRGTFVTVHCNGLDAESLQGDQNFLAQFPSAQQQHADSRLRAGRSQWGRPVSIGMHEFGSGQRGDYRMAGHGSCQ